MIQVYFGELTVTPIPLELSFASCEHRCAYCFANLSSPNRGVNRLAVLRYLSELPERQDLAAQLLRAGYPVLCSNRSDPFSINNYRTALRILEDLTDYDIPIAFQTKGGRGIDDALKFLPPSAWYVTIEMLDPVLQKKITPGAPLSAERFALVEKLAINNHRVVVAINPCVPEWLPDPRPLLKRAKQAGAWGVWIERLHLSKAQIKAMTPGERAAMGPTILTRAQAKGDPVEIEHFTRTRQIALEEGLEIFSMGQPNPSEFWYIYSELYPKLFPTLQDWVNQLAEARTPTSDLLSFDNYANFMCSRLPHGVLPIQSYLGSTSRGLWKSNSNIPSEMTYRDLLLYTWKEPSTRFSLVQSPAFAYAATWDDNDPSGWVQFTDDKGLPYMCYSRQGFDGFYNQVIL